MITKQKKEIPIMFCFDKNYMFEVQYGKRM